VPGGGGYVFEPNFPRAISGGERGFSGRNGVLTVRFPGTRTDFNATLVKISPDSDVAEIKIDATNLSKLDLAEDGSVGLGDKIILLGYPGMSNQSYAEAESNARGITRFFIPEPTVTEGVVAKLPSQPTKKDQGEIKMKDKFGNMYQLDISAGSGTSGGPVLDKRGKVIGLMSMGLADEEHVGLLQIVGLLTVIVHHGVVERIDAPEIFGIEGVLRADLMRRFRAEIGLEEMQNRTENRQARQAEVAAFFFQPSDQIILKQRVENDAGRLLDFDKNPVELLLRAHQRMHMLDRHDFGVLRGGCPGNRNEGFAG